MTLIMLLAYSMVTDEKFAVRMPNDLSEYISRLLAVFMMHNIVEISIRQGLMVMKYASNHPFDCYERKSEAKFDHP